MPLAITAACTAGQWWAVILLVGLAWWWSPRVWEWEWLVALGRGMIGAEWAYLGASSFAAFPGDAASVGIVWTAAPIALALVARVDSRRGDR